MKPNSLHLHRIGERCRQRARDERGFALPMTIFLVTMITILLTSAFSRSASEQAVSTGSTAVVKAMSVAQSGLQAFMGDSFSARPLSGDSVRYNVVDGYAWVVPIVMHVPSDTMLGFTYIVRSTGYYIEPNQGSLEQGKREVAQFVRWNHGIARMGAWVSPGSSDFDDTDPPLASLYANGNDACGEEPPVPGIQQHDDDEMVPTEWLDSISGSPSIVRSQEEWFIAHQLGINWQAIESGQWEPDYTTLAGDETFSTYLLNTFSQDIGPSFSGTGLLIVTDRINSYGFHWKGIVIAGKDFDVEAGNTTIEGMLITGMDELNNESTLYSDLDVPGTSLRIQYNSCYVNRALASIRGLRAVNNTWVDNWAMY